MINVTNIQKYIPYCAYTLCYMGSMGLSRTGHHYSSGMILMAAALMLYILEVRKVKTLVSMRGLFTLSWVGGQGIACLQLSRLQTDWEGITWLCFYLAYVCFCISYDFVRNRWEKTSLKFTESKDSQTKTGDVGDKVVYTERIAVCIIALTIISVICFAVEAVVVGFIPLFSDMPHAYSYFHISGVHYFTISCILTPALTVIYWSKEKKRPVWMLPVLLICNVIAVAVPILCVSRFQLLFAVGFALMVYIIIYNKITPKMIIGFLVVMVPVYVLLTVARNHDIAYLNGIFEMKNSNTPIFITQPYMYIANNFENFNCMVRDIQQHTYGIRMLFPLFALTGLKFIFPQVTAMPIFITKTELTTLTVFYDAYYDFGIGGMIGLPLILGVAAAWITRAVRQNQNPIVYLLYGQVAIYLGLSFFTTWFSNPTTWFWFALTLMMYLFVQFQRNNKGKINE